MINIGLGLVSGSAFFIYSTEMGYRGYLVICQLASAECQMAKLSYTAKLALSILSGFSSGVLGFLSGFESVTTAKEVYDYSGRSISHAGLVLLIIGGSLVSGFALTGAANVISITPNLFNITANSAQAYIFMGACEYMAALYDVQAIMALIKKHEINYERAMRWLEKNKLSTESIQALRQHSYFRHQKETTHLLEGSTNKPLRLAL